MRPSTSLFFASAAVVSALSIAAPPPCWAGLEFTTEIDVPSGVPPATPPSPPPPAAQQPPARPGRMLLDGERVRMEVERPGGGTSVMIYRGDRNLVWSVDDKRKSYTEVDGARMQAVRAQSEAARERMRGELDKMPPDKRVQMQRMLAAADATEAKRAPPSLKETGRTDKVGTLACHEVEVSRGGTKESEICVADWKAAGVTKADVAAVRKLGTFQDSTMGGSQARRQGDDVLDLFDGFDGLPVRVRTFRGGEPRTEFRIVKVERKPIDAKLFAPPDGYTKREFAISMPGAAGKPRTQPSASP